MLFYLIQNIEEQLLRQKRIQRQASISNSCEILRDHFKPRALVFPTVKWGWWHKAFISVGKANISSFPVCNKQGFSHQQLLLCKTICWLSAEVISILSFVPGILYAYGKHLLFKLMNNVPDLYKIKIKREELFMSDL